MAGSPGLAKQPYKNNPFEGNQVGSKVVWTVGAKSGNVINVAAQLYSGDLKEYVPVCVGFVFSTTLSTTGGNGITPTAPSGGIAIGTNGLLLTEITNEAGDVITNASGQFDINVTQTTGTTFYLYLLMADGSLAVSPALAF